MKTFFHISKSELRAGLELAPGKWGSEINRMPFLQIAQSVIKELIFEEERNALMDGDNLIRVSRLQCIFACPTLNDARDFRNKTFVGGKIYEIQVEDTVPVFEADSEFIENCHTVEQVRDNASKYWRGESTPSPVKEVLIGGPIKVVRLVE